jgi:hypothetical protein
VKVTIAGADVSRYYNGDQFGRTSVQLSAFDLEVGLGTVVIPEIAGTDAFVTGRQCMVEQGTTVLVDGFLASDDRGRLETEPTKPRREWTMSLEDANAITSNIRAIDWTRSSETCTARILARISADGFSVDTTWVQSTSATLPAKKYKTGDIWSELATDAIERTGWTLFVHDKAGGGRCFHFHSLTTGHACGLSITDVMGAWDNVTSFVPISPRRIRDPADLRNDIILEDQNGRTATVSDSTSISAHDADGRQHQEYVQVDADSQADLDLQAARMLLDRKDDITTYECTIGPLDETALGSIRVGDMMTVTSQVFGLTASSQRIANMTLTPLGPTLWTATLELSRPVRHGNKIPGMDGGRDGGGTGGGGNSDPGLKPCNDCPPFVSAPPTLLHTYNLHYLDGTAIAGPSTLDGDFSGSWQISSGTQFWSPGGTSLVGYDLKHFGTTTAPPDPSGVHNHRREFLALVVGGTATHARLTGRIGNTGSIAPVNWTLEAGNWPIARPSAGGTPPAYGYIGSGIGGGTLTVASPFAAIDVTWPISGGMAQWVLKVTTDPTVAGDFSGVGIDDPTAPDTSWTLRTYQASTTVPVSGQFVGSDVPSGSVDGSNATFATTFPYMSGSLSVTVNSVDWTSEITSQNPSTGSFTLSHAPKAGSDVVVMYRSA